MPLSIIITGAPASGKGTQCERIVKKYGVVHLSTGDLLRAAVAAGTDLGKQAHGYMTTGKLVPDDLVISLVKEKLNSPEIAQKGWLLDGFPRTKAQADALKQAGVEPTHVILLDVPDEILADRAVGRRSDPATGKIYHIKNNPPPSGLHVIQRDDDTEEKVKNRLVQYHNNLAALKEAYKSTIKSVNGDAPPDTVFVGIDAILSKKTI